jgi:hypothetical protein
MRFAELPAEIWPMKLTAERVRHMTPITSLDIYDGASSEFHDEGLYSTAIFGRVGSPQRETTFSYIDLKVEIFHPKIFRDLMTMKSIYRGIVAGRETAIFDEQLGDFIADTSENSDTGYAFFVKHFPKLRFRKTKSPTRQQRVIMLERYRDSALTRYLPVIPAGIRDLEISDSGAVTKNEIHNLYFRALSISNTIPMTNDMESPAFDIARNALTNTMAEIYDLLEGMIAGKNGYIQDKWAARRVAYGTRNVLTVMDTSISDLGDKNAPGFDSTTMGLHQVMRSITPVTIHHIRQLLENRIQVDEGQAQLVDKTTLKSVWVELKPTTRDKWATRDGLESVIDSYQVIENRHRPVEIEGHYLALIYRGPDNTFKIFYDIDDLPDHLDKSHVYPLSLVEMLYLSAYRKWNDYFVQVSRYPISGTDSMYPSRIYVKTTIVGEQRRELGDDWQPLDGDDYLAIEFPKASSSSFMDSQSPHSTRLKGLNADFDGDMGGGTVIMSKEALAENDRKLRSRSSWVDVAGNLRASYDYDTLNYVVTNMTGRFRHGMSNSR